MKERLSKLLTIKSLVTLSLTAVIVYKSITGTYDVEDIYLMIISFYFGTQAAKEK